MGLAIAGGSCCCGGNTSVQLLGCASTPIQGATVSVYASSGGSLLFTGTTNSSGIVSGTIPATGTYWLVSSGPSTFPQTRYAYSAGSSVGLAIGVTNTITLAPASGYTCCGTMTFPIQSTLYLTVCGQTFTLSTSIAVGGRFAFASAASPITTAGVAVDNGTCSWSGYPSLTTGSTLWSVGLSCPTPTAMSGLITTSALGHFNAGSNSYDAYALAPSGCSPLQVCQTTALNLTGTVGETISLSGTMPASINPTCTPGVTPYAMPCAGSAITVTN